MLAGRCVLKLKLKRSSVDKQTGRPMARAMVRAMGWVRQRWGRPARKAVPVAAAPGRASTLAAAELPLVRRDLSAVLDQHPDARTVMRFVRALEHGLRKKGRHALDELPVEVVRRAMGQLDAVVVDWSPEGLCTLRSKAALAIAERERLASSRQAALDLAAYEEVEVEEASVTTFMAASEEWERSFTGRSGATPHDAEAGHASAERLEAQPA